jgi:hypothetical protein
LETVEKYRKQGMKNLGLEKVGDDWEVSYDYPIFINRK